MRVDAWFYPFVKRHMERMPRNDYAPPGSEFWETIKHAFIKKGVTETVADEASRNLVMTGTVFPDNLCRALLEQVELVWACSEVAPDVGDDRKAAEDASRSCEDCQGNGFAIRWRQHPEEGKPHHMYFYCWCALGRWIERNHREKQPQTRKRFHDLLDYPQLRGEQYRQPPLPAAKPATIPARPAEALAAVMRERAKDMQPTPSTQPKAEPAKAEVA